MASDNADYRFVTYETLDEGTIARIMLNRPEARNAQNRGLLVELHDAFLRAEADDEVRVVILGQDPYHGPGQAHGLCFSVQPGVPTPPSLVNIYKELKRDLNIDIPSHGCLQSWADQGVLLLNTTMTVERANAASHAKKGWEHFTDRIIQVVSETQPTLVFLLWGAHAQGKQKLIDATKHLVLTSVHPSPLSAYRGFIGNGHFSRTNKFLEQNGLTPINWTLPAD